MAFISTNSETQPGALIGIEGLSSVITTRKQLLRGGYAPIPTVGKGTHVKGWSTRLNTNPEEIETLARLYPDHTNTGILTARTPCLDIDLLVPEAAEAVEEELRHRFSDRGRFLVRYGRRPKRAIPFRVQTPFDKIKLTHTTPRLPGKEDGLEFLGNGQQIIVDGIHPDTQKPYYWHGCEQLSDVNWDELPEISVIEATLLIEEMAELVKEFGYSRYTAKPKSESKPNPQTDTSEQPKPEHSRANGAGEHVPSDWGDLFTNIHAGERLHDSLRDLSAKMAAAGTHPGAITNMLRGLMNASPTPRDPRFWERLNEIPRLANSAGAKFTDNKNIEYTPLNEIDAGINPGRIPPRGWLLANQFCRTFLSSLIATGGTGKTAVRLLQYLALATGQPLTGEYVFRRCRVLLLSFEDDINEMQRRIAAALLHHNIDRTELQGWLFIDAPKGLKLAEMGERGNPQRGVLEKMLRDTIKRQKIDILCLDPFVKLHTLEENSNGAMDFVCGLLTQIAIECEIAVDVPHHTTKGAQTPGDVDKSRGASAIKDAGRLISTLTPMDPLEAKLFGISETDRREYVRLDPAKVNIARRAQKARWFRMVDVNIQNATDEYPNGDQVQTIEIWTPPDTWADTSTDTINLILDEIDAGLPDGQRYSSASAARDLAAWAVVQRHYPEKTPPQCREMVNAWVKNEVLKEESYHNSTKRKDMKGLKLDTTKRPGKVEPWD